MNNLFQTKDKWIYSAVKNDETVDYKITSPDNKKMPKHLYKYYSFADRNFDALFRNYIYASHPYEFNDPYDCHEKIININTKIAAYQLYKSLFTENERSQFPKMDYEQLVEKLQIRLKEVIYRNFGLVSLTEKSDNMQMWAHYANHRGFAIEFDMAKLDFGQNKFHGPFPINYQLTHEQINLEDINERFESVLYQSNVKEIGWGYEKEWRILIEATEEEYLDSPFSKYDKKDLGLRSRKFNYPKSSIAKFIFGIKFFDPEEIMIKDNQELEITPQNTIGNKAKTLDFILENNLNAAICLLKNNYKISPINIKIKKNDGGTYTFKQIV